MIAMRKKFANLDYLWKVEALNIGRRYGDVVDIVLDAPVYMVSPHLLRLLQVELPRTQEAQQIDLVPSRVHFAAVDSHHYCAELL
jgi:hypothetical protein